MAFTHRPLYTQALPHRNFFGRDALSTDTCTHKICFHTKTFHARKLLHINTFTHRNVQIGAVKPHVYLQTFTHRRFYTQRLLQNKALTHKHIYIEKFYKQIMLYTDPLYTDTFTYRPFYTQSLPNTNTWYQDMFIQRYSHTEHTNNFIQRDQTRDIVILPEFLMSNIHLARSCDGYCKIVINYNEPRKIAFCFNFWRISQRILYVQYPLRAEGFR